ncbi:MAG: ATP-grasp domain-containing protein [Ktedonobacteraceae bacterium]
MRFCFILEERYAQKPMPMVIADQLEQWGHKIEVLQPYAAVTSLTDLSLRNYDAYVLKTVSDGPGLTILEAAEAVGIPTINNSRAIRLVRDKAVAVAFAQARGLPVPLTYFVGHPRALVRVPQEVYPVVVKPSNGTSLQDIHLVRTPQEMEQLILDEHSYYLAMHYVENTGYDIKLYVTGQEVHAIMKSSPLHGEVQENEIPVTPEMLKIARRVGQVFGLDLYGVDVLQTPQGLMIVDINDFPSFYGVPRKVSSVAEYILHAAYRARQEHSRSASSQLAQSRKLLRRQDSSRIKPAELIPYTSHAKHVHAN